MAVESGPGFLKDCKDCKKCGPSFSAPRFNCGEVRLDHDGQTPIITNKDGVELTGDRTCWGFEKSSAASLRDFGTRASVIVYTIGCSLPLV